MNPKARYETRLREIRDYLASYGDDWWAPTLDEWIAELDDDLVPNGWLQHARRTKRSTGGMGSLGDVVICPENGHSIADDRKAISRANEKFDQMVTALYHDAESVIAEMER